MMMKIQDNDNDDENYVNSNIGNRKSKVASNSLLDHLYTNSALSNHLDFLFQGMWPRDLRRLP